MTTSTTVTASTTSTPNDIKAVQTKFISNLGNGKLAAKYFVQLVNACETGRNTTTLADTIVKAKNKGDNQAVRAMSQVIKAIWKDVPVKYSKKTGKVSISIKGVEADRDAITRMNEAVTKGLSLRDTFAKTVRGEVTKTKHDPVKSAQGYTKAHTKKEIALYIAALQAGLKAK